MKKSANKRPGSSNHFAALIAFLVLTAIHGPAWSTGTVFGATNAMACYEASQETASSSGLEPCNKAILQGDLNRRDLAATYSNRGVILSKMGKYENALEDHHKAVALRDDLPEIYINRGNAYYRMQQYEEALADYERAIPLNGGSGYLAHYNRGLVLIKLRDISGARTALEKALEMMPGNQMIQSRLDSLGSR